MAMNEAALKSMGKMIQTMLPYELGYKPKLNSTRTIGEIFALLREKNPKLEQFAGFMGYVLKQADEKESDDKEPLDIVLMEIWDIINKHYPPVAARFGDGSTVTMHPELHEDKNDYPDGEL